ncbi:YncE family protein [Psychroserpens sp. NJDZ02]|uniref:YncE family protein n=1 Tax=Psychroserpens sp. NJDZ02 TaxID=2570561 RepID=UPI0010A8ECC1|nr:cell surface protein [Psychroserpens sp. NJDZ02]QCE42236.1 cell surface protein [Psychroserpens sp. NJDZ02]
MKKVIYSIVTLSLLVFSCSNDDDAFMPSEPLGAYENGILVSGEGGPSSISYISNDFSVTENQVYFNVNDENLGVYLQSVGFNDDKAYVVVDAGTITIINRYTFEKLGTIDTGLTLPRYIAFDGTTAYVSDWADPNNATDDYVAVVDLNSNTVTSTIAVSEGPEQVLVNANKLYVSHKGGYNVNNVVSVINTIDSSLETITVNDVPDEMFIDNQGHLIVLSSGANQSWLTPPVETVASITRIDLNDNSIISNMEFSEGQHPGLMTYSDGNAYYVLNNGVYSLSDSDTSLPAASLFNITAGYAYGLSVKNNLLYVTDASFTENSTLKVYDIPAGTETNSFDVGLGASKIYFN